MSVGQRMRAVVPVAECGARLALALVATAMACLIAAGPVEARLIVEMPHVAAPPFDAARADALAHPASARAHFRYAQALADNTREREAWDEFLLALTLDPADTVDPADSFIDVAATIDRLDTADALVARLRKHHADSARLAWYAGRLQCERSSLSALQDFEQAVRLAPQAVLPRLWAAQLRLLCGDLEGALAHIEAADAAMPGTFEITCDRAAVLLELYRPREAAALWEKALRTRPTAFEVHRSLARCHALMLDTEAARREMLAYIRDPQAQDRHSFLPDFSMPSRYSQRLTAFVKFMRGIGETAQARAHLLELHSWNPNDEAVNALLEQTR